jgi:hypothetical protein
MCAEEDEMADECNCSRRGSVDDHAVSCPASMYRAGIDRGRVEGRRAAFEEVQAILVRPELWEERVRLALSLVTEYLTRPPVAK